MSRWVRVAVLAVVVGVAVGVVVALVGGGDGDGDGGGRPFAGGPDEAATTEPPEPLTPVVAAPAEETVVVAAEDADATARAVAISAALYREAPLVVTAPAGDVAAQALAASGAVRLGVPLLLVPDAALAPDAAPTGAPGAPTDVPPSAAPTTTSAAAVEPAAFDPAAVAQSPPSANATPSADPSAAPTAPPAPDAAVTAELRRLGAEAVVAVGDATARWAEGLDGPDGGEMEVAAAADASALAALVGGGFGATTPVAAEEVPRAVAGLERDATATLVVGAPAATPTEGATADPVAGSTPSAAPPTTPPTSSPGDADGGTLPPHEPAAPVGDLLVLVGGAPEDVAATASARAAGARVLVVPGSDPRASSDAIAALSAEAPGQVVAVGGGFGSAELLRQRLAVAATGVELPGGGQVVYPHRRMVALYGHPGTAALGVLGEQGVQEAIARANDVAAPYGPLSDVPVIPAFEIITTIASSAAGEDGDYSDEASIEHIRPWVDAAREAGIYVVLDLQPGRTDFLTQAQRYAELLAEPHVGLALDPEWRLEPDQVHLRQIGSVGIDEVNEVSAWLAQFTRERQLPQKLLILHQFRLSMIEDRERVDTSHDELAILIHADGNGSLGLKLESWNALTTDAPGGVWWGWKNFYDEDSPTPTPEQTMAVEPTPLFISYQ